MSSIKYFAAKNAAQNATTVKRLFAFTTLTLVLLAISAEHLAAQTSTFVNSTAIVIADNGTALPAYPSNINVTGVSGRITKVVVTLNQFTHALPDDVGILLVGPGGQKVRLMSDVGGSTPLVTPLNIPIDDRGAAYLADNAALANTVSKPTLGLSGSVGDGNTHPANFPAPAPAGPYSVLMSDFIGTGANGTWSLYVDDDTAGNVGTIANGWTLAITTGGVFTNSGVITLNNNAPASPYPSTVSVAGFTGSITKVSVRINSLNHPTVDDVGLLLVGPTGTAVHLTTDNGGSTGPAIYDLVFDDTAANFLPDAGPIFSTSYKPTPDGGNSGGSASHPANFAAPAPAAPYSATLAAFIGSNPNGTWRLYVDDDSNSDPGSIDGGWTLAIETGAPTAADAVISGRAVSFTGRGIANVRVTLNGGQLSEPLFALTNSFGYYKFENIPAGQTYIISVSAKRFRFTDPVQVINLSEDAAAIDFTAQP